MQTVGAAWLMVSLGAGPMYIALTQTASALPFFIFALPAGALGDIVDRRRLVLFTEFWMVGVATVLAGATIAGLRYVRFSPSLRALMLRSGTTMFFASALLALMPSVAESVSGRSTGYGLLLGCFGAGAVAGALALQPARGRWSADAVA